MLRQKREALNGAGYFLPAAIASEEDDTKGNDSHLGFKSNFERYANLEDAPSWGVLAKRIEGELGNSIIISGENIYGRVHEKESYEKIVSFFLKKNIKLILIAYVRDQAGWINSHYGQHLKALRSPISFQKYVQQALDDRLFEFGSMFLNPMNDDRVDFRILSFESSIKLGLERDFLNRVGASSVEFTPRKIANANFGAKGAYVARRIAKSWGDELGAQTPLRKFAKRYLKHQAIKRGWSDSPYMGFDDETAKQIRDHFRPSNDAFSQRFFGKPWAEMAPPKPVVRNVFKLNVASREEAAEVEAVVSKLERMIERRLKQDR